MTTIRAVIQQRRLDIPAPENLPDGTEVVVDIVPVAAKLGLDEADWRDDAQAIADWTSWLETIEPISFPAKDAFDEQFDRHNIEAVRKQMFGDPP